MFASAAELALRSSVLLGAAWLAACLTRAARGSAAVRHAVWMLGFATIASLPLLVRLLPPLLLPVLPAEAASPISAPIDAFPVTAVPPAEVHFDWLTFAYFTVALLLIARLAIGRMLLERLWQKAEHADRWHAEVGAMCRALAIRGRIEIRVTSEPVVPMTWGSLRPRILLPRTALGWSVGRRRSVLLHELGHVSRYDSVCSLIAQTVCAFYWANPLVWLAVRQMRLAQEQACDDLVLANHGPATSYARDLLDSACALQPRFARASLAMAGHSDLEKRLRSILGDESRRPLNGWFLAAAAAVAGMGGMLVATIIPVAASVSAPISAPADPIKPSPELRTAAAPIQARAETERGTSPSAALRHSTMKGTPALIPAALYVRGRESGGADPMAQYRSDLATYAVAVHRYDDDLQTYRRKCDDYQRKLREYRAKLASARPGDLPPVPPVPPVQPVQPVAPVQPVIPPTPPTPPTPPST